MPLRRVPPCPRTYLVYVNSFRGLQLGRRQTSTSGAHLTSLFTPPYSSFIAAESQDRIAISFALAVGRTKDSAYAVYFRICPKFV